MLIILLAIFDDPDPQAVRIREEEKSRRQRLEAMSFQANDYMPIMDKLKSYRKMNPENPFTNDINKSVI